MCEGVCMCVRECEGVCVCVRECVCVHTFTIIAIIIYS